MNRLNFLKSLLASLFAFMGIKCADASLDDGLKNEQAFKWAEDNLEELENMGFIKDIDINVLNRIKDSINLTESTKPLNINYLQTKDESKLILIQEDGNFFILDRKSWWRNHPVLFEYLRPQTWICLNEDNTINNVQSPYPAHIEIFYNDKNKEPFQRIDEQRFYFAKNDKFSAGEVKHRIDDKDGEEIPVFTKRYINESSLNGKYYIKCDNSGYKI